MPETTEEEIEDPLTFIQEMNEQIDKLERTVNTTLLVDVDQLADMIAQREKDNFERS
jgi:hypothetical protein